MIKFRALLFAVAFAPISAGAVALETYPDMLAFMREMAENHRFRPSDLARWFKQAEIRQDIIDAMDRPREALPWWQYKMAFATPDQARRGAAYWRKNAPVLEEAVDEYGVAPEIIIAIIGIETQYGRNTGRYSTLDALTTLTFAYPSRAEYFRKELEEFLLLTREQRMDPTAVKGSYAGALGIGQFMPSSYRAYAVDFDKDSVRDLLNSTDDAIGSVANFLRAHGWRHGKPVVGQIHANAKQRVSLDASTDQILTVAQLRKQGIRPVDNLAPEEDVQLLRFEEEKGPMYLLGYHNFGVITRYNRSHHYALAVYELAQMIRTLYVKEPKFPLGPS